MGRRTLSGNAVTFYTVWERWPGRGWVVMATGEHDDAVWVSGYSDAPECRILPEGERP